MPKRAPKQINLEQIITDAVTRFTTEIVKEALAVRQQQNTNERPRRKRAAR